MIDARYYQFLYLLLVTILTLSASIRYRKLVWVENFKFVQTEYVNWFLVLFMVFFIGTRPVSGAYFVDMANYVEQYHVFYEGVPFYFDLNAENLLFDNYFAWVGSMSLGTEFFFITIAFIYFVGAYLGIRRLFPTHTLAAYLVFLAAFSTFSYGTNGIKAGAAASLFIWAMGYRKNLKVCIPLALLSWGFHHSMQLPISAFILTWFYKNPKWYYYAWAFCMAMAFLHVVFFANLFAGFSDESGANYLAGEATGQEGTKGGFRIDFIIYSAMPVVVGYIMEMKRKIKISSLYRDLLHLYICINGIWMLCMYAEFTNRIAYLSWFLYPIVLIYPFLYEKWGPNKYRMFSMVMQGHLCFTLFMEMVYYGGFMRLF